MRKSWLQFSLLLVLLLTAFGAEKPPATQPAPIELTDIAGAVHRPLELGSAKAAVILFIDTDCPISNGYAPEINRMCKDYGSAGVMFYLVQCDSDLTVADAKKHAHDYGFTCPVMIDRKHELVSRVGASVTPEAVVIGPDEKIEYRGRIDDLYAALGQRRYEATTHELRNALDAVVAGKPVKVSRTTAVGCTISQN